MNTLLIFLAQTQLGATIEIIALLLGAGIIGYITAWLYYRSIYVTRIKEIVSEKENLDNQNVKLNADKSNLHKDLLEKDKEMENLILEIKALKALHKEGVRETKTQHSHLLDYNSFGTATAAEKDDLKMISGIGPVIEERLHSLDIYTFKQISRFTARDIETINDTIIYFSGRIDRDEWVAQAIELVHDEEKRTALFKRISDRKDSIYYNRIGTAKKEEADDLTIISGIGGWIMKKLNILDIYTFRQISNFNKEDVQTITEAIEYFPGRIERDEWILQARELIRIAGDKADLLKRIRERKGRIYYDRLGIAHKHEANNLTLIDGLGLWVEERLNTLDIFTFEQISKFTHADIETITEVLELIPGRIEEDNWVGQARILAKL
jgi:predicted flap endonuclease-1-like 5' DNA nuclease